MRANLTAHVGGSPSATQRVLIERAARLAAHLDKMDAEAFEAGGMSEHARKQYLAFDGAMRRAMLALGMDGKPEPKASLRDYINGKPAAARAAMAA
ncbi:MAG: hypothetical protein M0Z28_29025 [Rhodospirillales bacterium]|nr:hypothetical protein [Rhodospirillales bacterium]